VNDRLSRTGPPVEVHEQACELGGSVDPILPDPVAPTESFSLDSVPWPGSCGRRGGAGPGLFIGRLNQLEASLRDDGLTR
jgi:hypothetical protein